MGLEMNELSQFFSVVWDASTPLSEYRAECRECQAIDSS